MLGGNITSGRNKPRLFLGFHDIMLAPVRGAVVRLASDLDLSSGASALQAAAHRHALHRRAPSLCTNIRFLDGVVLAAPPTIPASSAFSLVFDVANQGIDLLLRSR